MKIKKTLSVALILGSFLGIIAYFSSENSIIPEVRAEATSQTADQGEIIVHYVDQNGNPIKADTVATGSAGTTYVASIPKISGYTYSRIENGQNDANGPRMVFGGNDPITHVMSMTIVYTATGKTNANGTATKHNGTSGTTTNNGTSTQGNSAKHHSASTTTTNGSKAKNTPAKKGTSSKNKSTSNTDANADNAKNETDATSPDSEKATAKAKSKTGKANATSKKNNDKQNKDDKAKPADHHLWAWLAGAVLLLAMLGGLIWKFVFGKKRYKH